MYRKKPAVPFKKQIVGCLHRFSLAQKPSGAKATRSSPALPIWAELRQTL